MSLGHHQHHVILRRMQGEFPNYRNGFKFWEAKSQTNKIQISTNFPLVSNTVKHCCKVMSKFPPNSTLVKCGMCEREIN